MDRRERFDSIEEAVRAFVLGAQAELWTTLPCVVQSFNAKERTCVVQPAVRIRYKDAVTGDFSWVKMPMLLDCPVMFPSGGGVTLTFPITKGDECLAIFSSRCIDAWWKSGGTENNQPIVRMHDLSDGFVFVGVSSLPKVIKNTSTTSTQLRSDDGLTVVDLNPKVGSITLKSDKTTVTLDRKTVSVDALESITLKAPKIKLIGDVDAKGKLTNNDVNVGSTHRHGGVRVGGDQTSGPG